MTYNSSTIYLLYSFAYVAGFLSRSGWLIARSGFSIANTLQRVHKRSLPWYRYWTVPPGIAIIVLGVLILAGTLAEIVFMGGTETVLRIIYTLLIYIGSFCLLTLFTRHRKK